MRTYDNYKDSGIKWIGEIPEHWEITKLKYIGKMYSGLSGKSGDDFKQDESPLNKPFIPFTNIANNEKINPAILQNVVINDDDRQNIVQKNDLFFMMSSENFDDVGKSTILLDDLGEVYLNSFCKGYRITDENVNAVFLNYLLLNHACRRRLMIEANGFTRINLKMEKVNDFVIDLPPLTEQTAIANYLDTKTTEIDQTIADKEALVDLYEEEKKALINEAVTKGLNPKVKLKPSGIDWLGDIPEHWEVKKLKYVAEIVLGKMLTPEDKGDYSLKPYLRAQNIRWLNVDISEVNEMWFSDSELLSYQIKKGDILVSEGGEVGRTCIWENELEECYIQNSVNKVTVNEGEPYFYLYNFYMLGAKDIFNSIVNKVSIAHLTKEKLKEITFSIPPIEEQTTIVQYIETETAIINEKINLAKQEIELLKEYRQALIFEAVTGKIKVCD